MFARQLTKIVRIYHPVPANEVLLAGRRTLHVTFDDAFRSVANALPTLQRLGIPATVFACSDYAEDGRVLGVTELANEVLTRPAELATMRWGELRALADEGIEVGSHTASHPHLTQLEGSELRRELLESRRRIEDELGRRCRFLAYPFGEADDHVRAAARAAGYLAAFALRTDRNLLDSFSIPRLGIWRNDRLLRTAAKIALRRDHKRSVRQTTP
jgi:peptidoglycan/xylan/chitin deacetylase (PgdA/CDA1 family)